MTWARLDDGFWRNPKVAALTDAQFRLYVNAISYAAEQLTDGHISPAALRALGISASLTRPKTVANALANAELFDSEGKGYCIHDYLEYNPSKADVQAKRAADAERKREERSRRESQRDSAGSHDAPTQGKPRSKERGFTYGDDDSAPKKGAPSSPKTTTENQRLETWWRTIGTLLPENATVSYLARDFKISEAEAATRIEQLQR